MNARPGKPEHEAPQFERYDSFEVRGPYSDRRETVLLKRRMEGSTGNTYHYVAHLRSNINNPFEAPEFLAGEERDEERFRRRVDEALAERKYTRL
ncbi:MAG: hypothetical protein HY518_00040 [Candidatus Aenigmarchaeota archaeon]|nr:hypothetical protein [Candidatus Aenigmarchaeota archaeon]